jgi:hypothetical protein
MDQRVNLCQSVNIDENIMVLSHFINDLICYYYYYLL